MSDLTRLTVNLTPKAAEALNTAAERSGDTRTDTVNRALALYEFLTRPENRNLMVRAPDGTWRELLFL